MHFVLGRKIGFCCLNVTWESIIFTTFWTTKIHYNRFVFTFLKCELDYKLDLFFGIITLGKNVFLKYKRYIQNNKRFAAKISLNAELVKIFIENRYLLYSD